ncbi:MAG: hypothetical protein ACOX9C_00850 [Kiritimatiellia bacterium]|jgi:hypothetical protein
MRKKRANWNYAAPGVYSLTLHICEPHLLAHLTATTYDLTPLGRLVEERIRLIPKYTPEMAVSTQAIMPDHVHLLVHVLRPLPAGATLQTAIRGFKLGVNKAFRLSRGWAPSAGEEAPRASNSRGWAPSAHPIFKPGFYDTIIYNKSHLARAKAYIEANVATRQRMLADPELFKKLARIPSGKPLGQIVFRGIGNRFLLKSPEIEPVQFSRKATEADWAASLPALDDGIRRRVVFASPFLSPLEKRAKGYILEHNGRCIHFLVDDMTDRYKPGGDYFAACADGRLLEIGLEKNTSIPSAILLRLTDNRIYLRNWGGTRSRPTKAETGALPSHILWLDLSLRTRCLFMNAAARHLATTPVGGHPVPAQAP